MIDTHCHLNFKAFNKNCDQVIKDALAAGINGIVVPGTDVETSIKAVEIAEKYHGVYAAVGIHPHHANVGAKFISPEFNVGADFISARLKELEKLIQHPKVVAIGEAGIDKHEYQNTKYETYTIDDQFVEAQKELLIGQIKLAIKYNKSLILHNREAKKEMLEILTEPVVAKALAGKAVFHCCEPDNELLDFAIKHNIFIGVDGDITYNQKKQEFVKKVPPDLLVLETDSPLLLPEPLRSQKKYPNVPANITLINQFIAKILSIPKETLARQTTQNAKTLFSL